MMAISQQLTTLSGHSLCNNNKAIGGPYLLGTAPAAERSRSGLQAPLGGVVLVPDRWRHTGPELVEELALRLGGREPPCPIDGEEFVKDGPRHVDP